MERAKLFSSLLVLLALVSCHSEEHHEHEAEESSKLIVTRPVKKDTSFTENYVCQVHARRHVKVRSIEKGYLQKVYVNEGQQVREGQLMFKVLPIVYKAELEKAKAEFRSAKIKYDNTKSLADSNIVSKNELAIRKAEYENAKAELAVTQAHLNFTKIKAPFSGIVNKLHEQKGSLLEEGGQLTSLSDISKLWVYFNVPEAEYLDYMTQAKRDSFQVGLLMANNKVYEHPGMANVITGEFDHETGNITFRATFPNPDRLLRHGETGNILWRKSLEDALIIPQKATYEILNKKYVYVVDENDVVHLRQITIDQELEDLYAIKKGLKENEKILLEGIRHVKDDEQIAYEYRKADSVIAHQKVYTE